MLVLILRLYGALNLAEVSIGTSTLLYYLGGFDELYWGICWLHGL
jgi:hypothetical protein